MKNILALILMLVTLTACTSEEYLIASKKSAVVVIFAEHNEDPTKSGMGTGFLIKENYIITNFHVAGESSIKLTIAMDGSNKTYEAELVFGDKSTDVAVIKVKNWEEFKKDNPQLSYLEFANNLPTITDEVWAIGHPWGLFYSISKGIISTESRKSPGPIPMWWIQTDADIFNGNSGGPLLNEQGKVVGMNSVMVSNDGGSYGFAIPYTLIQKIINDLGKYKEVRWASLGIDIESPDVTIKEISPDSAAQAANLQTGDQIIAVRTENTILVNVTTAFDLILFLSTLDYEDKVQITVKRNDELIYIMVQPKFRTNLDFEK